MMRFFFIFSLIFALAPVGAAPFATFNCEDITNISPVIKIDDQFKFEGKSSICVNAGSPCRVTVAEFDGIEKKNFILHSAAMVKTDLAPGAFVFEIVVKFNGGYYYSRAIDQRIVGKKDWQKVTTDFFFKQGQSPEKVYVNLIIEGSGKVWIDDIKLSSRKNKNVEKK
jgi:hypothetical protein